MPYAVMLFFDNDIENQIQSIWKELVETDVDRYLYHSGNRPHIKLAIFEDLDLVECWSRLQSLAASTAPFSIDFKHFGVFPNPKATIFLGPAVTQSLLAVKKEVDATLKDMGKYPDLAKKTNEALAAGGLAYDPGSLKVRHLLEVVVQDVGFEAIAEKVSKPLSGLRVAPYYGCLVVRPDFDNGGFDDPEYPQQLDLLLDALGADVIDFPMKAHCCGGHMTQISEDTAFELIRQILHNAEEYEADAIVTICPMCQLNLDAYQSQVNRHFKTKYKIPVLYFTQMIGLAIGMEPRKLGIGKEFVSARKALAKIGTAIEEEAEPVRRRRDDRSLPMPGS